LFVVVAGYVTLRCALLYVVTVVTLLLLLLYVCAVVRLRYGYVYWILLALRLHIAGCSTLVAVYGWLLRCFTRLVTFTFGWIYVYPFTHGCTFGRIYVCYVARLHTHALLLPGYARLVTDVYVRVAFTLRCWLRCCCWLCPVTVVVRYVTFVAFYGLLPVTFTYTHALHVGYLRLVVVVTFVAHVCRLYPFTLLRCTLL